MLQLETMGLTVGSAYHGSKWALWEESNLVLDVPVSEAGAYRITIRAESVSEDSETATLGVLTGGANISEPVHIGGRIHRRSRGRGSIELSLENPSLGVSISPRRAVIDFIEVEGPLSNETRTSSSINI